MANYSGKLGEMTPDNLIANIHVKQIIASGTVVSGAGALKRGTVVALSDGKLAMLGSVDDLTAYGILCDDVDATSADAVAEIYLTGQFNKAALIVADGYTLTDADIAALRNGGIFIENTVK